MSFSGQSSFGDRASRGSKANDSGPIDESALKALAQRFDLEIIFRLSISQNLSSAPSCLALCINLTDLDLSGNSITKLEHLDGLVELKKLNLTSNKLSTIEGLWQRNAHISDDEKRKSGLRKLVHLSLSGNLITSLDGLRLDELAKNLPSLRSLYLQTFDRCLQNGVCRKTGYKEAVLARLPGLTNLDGERNPSASSFHQTAIEVEALISNPPPKPELFLPSPEPWITEEALGPHAGDSSSERSAGEIEYESKVKAVIRGIDESHTLFEVLKSELSKAQAKIISASTN